MRIAVAMATFRGERFLDQQLASIAAQTRPPDSLFVSDDASDDRTVAMLEKFAASAIFPVHVAAATANVGVTGNYERAIAACDGELIVLSDQDDVWLPNKLEYLERVFESSPDVGYAFSDAYLIDGTGKRTGERLWAMAGFNADQQMRMRLDPFGQVLGRSIVSGCTLAFRTKWRDLLTPFPAERTEAKTRVLHDRWASIVLPLVSGVAVIEEPLVEYRIHTTQQVGIPALQIRKRVPSSVLRWRSAAIPTREHAARMRVNIGLLRSAAERVGSPLDQVEQAIRHLEVRAAIDGSRFRRVAPVVRELVSRRYHEYSLGAASAFADLIRIQSRPVASAPPAVNGLQDQANVVDGETRVEG